MQIIATKEDEGAQTPPDNSLYGYPEAEVSIDKLADHLAAAADDTVQVRVRLKNKLAVAIHLNRAVKANHLVVMFHGMRRVPSDKSVAMFFRHQWTSVYRAPILCISDPTTDGPSVTQGPRSGLCIGSPSDPLAPYLNQIIDIVCQHMQIALDQCVLYGASAGAGSALLVGAQRKAGGGVVAVCPLLLLDKVKGQSVAAAAEAVGLTEPEVRTLLANSPERISPMHAMQVSIQSGQPTRFFIAQCKEDNLWLSRNFRHLWQFFELPLGEGGGVDRTGKLSVATYSSVTGHGAEPGVLSRALWRAAMAHLLPKATSLV